MRKLTASFFMSLDGVVDAPQDWHFPYMDPEMMEAVGATMEAADTILLGRTTFEEWASYWPSQAGTGGMADFINETPKYVVSQTLESVGWRNSTIIRGDVLATVAALKEQAGREISVTGSGTLVRSLLLAGLVDELRLMVHPVVVGRGKHLFEDGADPKRLAVASSQQFANGVLSLTYVAEAR
jgi:dihydrofolate reductase